MVGDTWIEHVTIAKGDDYQSTGHLFGYGCVLDCEALQNIVKLATFVVEEFERGYASKN